MGTRSASPRDTEVPGDRVDRVEVVSAVGRFEGFFEVVGVKKPGGRGCWCLGYRDSRVAAPTAGIHAKECATEPGPGVLAYVRAKPAGWCSIAPRSSYRRLMHSRTIPILDDRMPGSQCASSSGPPSVAAD